jgi:hypothetical protein
MVTLVADERDTGDGGSDDHYCEPHAVHCSMWNQRSRNGLIASTPNTTTLTPNTIKRMALAVTEAGAEARAKPAPATAAMHVAHGS